MVPPKALNLMVTIARRKFERIEVALATGGTVDRCILGALVAKKPRVLHVELGSAEEPSGMRLENS